MRLININGFLTWEARERKGQRRGKLKLELRLHGKGTRRKGSNEETMTAYTRAQAHVETRKPEPLIHGPRHTSKGRKRGNYDRLYTGPGTRRNAETRTAYTRAPAHVERAETRKSEPLIHGPRHTSTGQKRGNYDHLYTGPGTCRRQKRGNQNRLYTGLGTGRRQ
jgi:hypothetical protein